MCRNLLQSFTKPLIAISILFLLLFSNLSRAQTPTYAYSPTSFGTNVFPLANTTNMCQWLYKPSDFTPTVPGGQNITVIYIKAGNTITTGGTFTNLQIKMGYTTLSCSSSGTWISGLTTVYYNSSATISSWTTGGWVPITLQTPFY
jgi:hypothetical protein